MEELDIIQPLTDNQRLDMTDARENKTRTLRHAAIKQFEKRQAELFTKGKPFCFRCAKIEFEKAQEDLFALSSTRAKYAAQIKAKGLSYIAKNIPVKVNLAPYEDAKRFKLVKTDTVKESQRVNGSRVTYLTTYDTYRCLVGGCNLSLQISEELEKPRDDVKKK